MKKLLTLFFYISVAVGSMSAQLYLTPDTSFAHAGDKAQVNIRVKNFNKLTGLQFSLNWNPAVLKYDTVSNFNLP
ncbi:MAG TPA: cohesin domain-containing protein, partial [Saprospiraceae bacterium]|nr:cohesin domain-containing protein [Saprospiraceae bacterium]